MQSGGQIAVSADRWNRFAHWPRWGAQLMLAGFVLLLALAVLTWPVAPVEDSAPSVAADAPASAAPQRDTDLQLYDRIAARVRSGEYYYTSAVVEQRAANFPVKPGFAVRLPTLAYLTAAVGQGGLAVLAAMLGLATLAAWWRRLGEEPGAKDHRTIAMLLLVVGTAMGLKAQYLVLHEVWAGMLIALALALYRPGRWVAAWLAAALALAIREQALPFVLLLGALALWRRDWREAAAWAALTLLFAAGMVWHLAEVSQHLLPTDRPSPSWLALRGLAGWTGNVVASSSLYLLPGWLAAPLAMLPLLGWAGWKSQLGLTATLFQAGYGVLFMIAGRENNFYWALVTVPSWFVGLAFVPRALAGLWHAARLKA